MADGRFDQGRVRVNKNGANELREALEAHIEFLLDARGAVVEIDDARRMLNGRIEHARRVLTEVERTARERGWSQGDQSGEPQRTHA